MSKALKTIAGSADRPLVIGNIAIECYVLENKARVISQAGLSRALGYSRGGQISGAEMPRFASSDWLKPFINKELSAGLKSPILFVHPTGGIAYGYKATILVDLCAAVIDARDAGVITPRRSRYAYRADSILRGLGKIGILAWVDHATGYNPFKDKEIIEEIVKQYISPVLRPWVKTFQIEFYIQIGRLKGWVNFDGKKRPAILGRITNEIVYGLMPPGVLEKLQELNPIVEGGYRREKHHQLLSEEYGYVKLIEHLTIVQTLLDISQNWTEFERLLQRKFPRADDRLFLDLEDS